jgi:hypothetical protein
MGWRPMASRIDGVAGIRARMALTLVALASMMVPARAQVASAGAGDAQPWSVGVTDAQRARAQELLDRGNDLFLTQAYGEALKAYGEALRIWDHPAIRFNMVRALINLGRTLEAYDNLVRAMAYGPAPLTELVYADAVSYLRLLEAQIGTLEISCAEPSAHVTLDGQAVLTGPGKVERRLLPGPHQVIAAKAGFLPQTREVMALPAKAIAVSMSLIRLEDAAIEVRRWAPWKPWAVVGGGLSIVAAGGLLQARARADYRSYDAEVEERCPSIGCDDAQLSRAARDLHQQAWWETRVGIGSVITGGVVTVAGLVGVVLNLPRTELPADLPSRIRLTMATGTTSVEIGIAVGY